mmetsp:Transcript_41006/g.72109  ORF Transcript_41006/g.72109 Transcript_41006/m.72109 type:complete len:285 (-) Transcript_41006:65-919(-)
MSTPDYYAVLGITRSASAAEVRSAYRQQALLHHPDKNPDRLQEATDRFKLIAEAYSVLQDPQRRAAYDAGGTSTRVSGNSQEDVGFSADRARDLFSEVFGADFAAKLAQAAGGVVDATTSGIAKAGNKVGKTRVVRGAVAAHLSSLADEAHQVVASKQKTEALLRLTLEDHVKMLKEHEQKRALVKQERKERRLGFFGSIKEFVTSEVQLSDDIVDYKDSAKTSELQARVRVAEMAWLRANRELSHAEQQVARAEQEVEDVQQHGASLGHAAKAGAALLGRVFG